MSQEDNKAIVGGVMQRQAGDDRVEGIGSSELLECGGAEEVTAGRVGIDRHHVVS